MGGVCKEVREYNHGVAVAHELSASAPVELAMIPGLAREPLAVGVGAGVGVVAAVGVGASVGVGAGVGLGAACRARRKFEFVCRGSGSGRRQWGQW